MLIKPIPLQLNVILIIEAQSIRIILSYIFSHEFQQIFLQVAFTHADVFRKLRIPIFL